MFPLSWYPMSTLSSPSWRSRPQAAGPRLSTPVPPTWQQSLSSIPQVCLSIWVPALVVPPALTDLRHSSTLWWFPCWIPWYTVWGTKKSKMPWEGCKRRAGIAEATDSEISDGFFLSESLYTITFLWMKYNKSHTAFGPRKLNLTHNIPKWMNSWIMLHKQYFYILGPHYFQPTWNEASPSIDTSTSICETLEFSVLLLLFHFWEGALFHLGLLTLKERQLTEASGVCKPCLPDILVQFCAGGQCLFCVSDENVCREGTYLWAETSVPLAWLGFPGGSAGKESACNAGNMGSIPGLGRSPGEGKG